MIFTHGSSRGWRGLSRSFGLAAVLLAAASLQAATLPAVLREIGDEFASIEADLGKLEAIYGTGRAKPAGAASAEEAEALVEKIETTYRRHRIRLKGLEPSLRRSAARKGADIGPILDEFDRIGIRIRRRARRLRALLATRGAAGSAQRAGRRATAAATSAKPAARRAAAGDAAAKAPTSGEGATGDAGELDVRTRALLAQAERLLKERPKAKAPGQARCGLEGPDPPGLTEGQVLLSLRTLRSDMETPQARFWSRIEAREMESSLTFGLGRHAWAVLYLPDVATDTTLRNAAATVVEFNSDFTDFFSAGLWLERVRPRWTWTAGVGFLSVSHDEALNHPLRSNQNDAVNALPAWDYARYRHQTLCGKRTWRKAQAGFLVKHVDWNRSIEAMDILEWGLVTEFFATRKLAIAAEWLKADFSWEEDDGVSDPASMRALNLGVQVREGNWRFRLESRFLNRDDREQYGLTVGYRF